MRRRAAWEAVGQPYPLAAALLRAAEAALSHGDRDGACLPGAPGRRVDAAARRPPMLSDDIALLARRARISFGPADDAGTPRARAGPAGADRAGA